MKSSGFTLIELMFVVAIVMVLCTVAVASYLGFMRQARMQEAVAFLGTIRIRQETYFQTYSQYIDTTTNENEFYPDVIWPRGCRDTIAKWNIACTTSTTGATAGWCALGISPIDVGETLFQYMTIGWAPGDTIANCSSSSLCLVPDSTRPWWVAVAQGDQRCAPGSMNAKSLVVMTSQVRDVMIFDVNEGSKEDDWENINKQSLAGAISN
jgi:prepilin-type N-terminal cleavage/methylation domain-containing protein